ncbi:ubiquinol-cytochrome-c reductase complex assembly factor 1 [Diorhabda sublineata]|uniref:ubiquinol-cytochrome-c reductase complex assembly factor 1 n=1 Tax=Diorhabda sublineata TaxID=1163346 RepID=UPI0024E06EF0|nr:ubiquinol-cytochrome-c reductase complex assembly factor 1 [Diorhabda sublineata]
MNTIKLFNHVLGLRTVLYGSLQKNALRICCSNKILHNNVYNQRNLQFISTYEVKNVSKEDSIFKKFLKKVPFVNFDSMKIKARGYVLYEEIADKIDYMEYFKEFDLPDTFYSWFSITELYVWMLSVRAMAEGEDGKILRNSIIEALWADVGQRIKKLGPGNTSSLKTQVQELSEQMQAAFIAYDEGIQSDDIVLAGAIWRRFYKMEHVDPHNLDKFVRHIRKQVCVLDSLSKDNLFKANTINWLPIENS